MFFCLKIEKNRNFKNSDENTQKTSYKISLSSWEIREQITPKGDGNPGDTMPNGQIADY